MNVITCYEPAHSGLIITLNAVWMTSIFDNGFGLQHLTPIKPTARQVRRWKKEVKLYRSEAKEGGCCCFECMNRRGLA